jgi:Flp pilus assembly protein TadG
MLIKLNEKVRNYTSNWLRRFNGDERGAAAIEFAFIAPLLITMYLGTMEISRGLQVNKKVGRSASATADLIAQIDDGALDKATIESIMKIGKATLQPYSLTQPTIIATGITINAAGAATVSWSRQMADTTASTPYAAGSAVTGVPAKLLIANTFLIKVQTKLEYRSVTAWSLTKNKSDANGPYAAIDMSEVYYLRPRTANSLACNDC